MVGHDTIYIPECAWRENIFLRPRLKALIDLLKCSMNRVAGSVARRLLRVGRFFIISEWWY